MIAYWIVIVALIVLAFAFIRMRHSRHKLYLILLVFLLLFVYITATKVLSGQDLSWRSASDIGKAIKLYVTWLGSVANNFKDIIGHAIKLDWNFNQTPGS